MSMNGKVTEEQMNLTNEEAEVQRNLHRLNDRNTNQTHI